MTLYANLMMPRDSSNTQVAMNAIPCHKSLEDVGGSTEKTHSRGKIYKVGSWEETSQKPRLSGYLRIRWEW